jgi:hypothetical protein
MKGKRGCKMKGGEGVLVEVAGGDCCARVEEEEATVVQVVDGKQHLQGDVIVR